MDRLDSPFVGRVTEMAELTVSLEDALSGRGRLVMLVGEPGIGKTRTAQELAAIAEQRGAQVLVLRGAGRATILALDSAHSLLHPG